MPYSSCQVIYSFVGSCKPGFHNMENHRVPCLLEGQILSVQVNIAGPHDQSQLINPFISSNKGLWPSSHV